MRGITGKIGKEVIDMKEVGARTEEAMNGYITDTDVKRIAANTCHAYRQILKKAGNYSRPFDCAVRYGFSNP